LGGAPDGLVVAEGLGETSSMASAIMLGVKTLGIKRTGTVLVSKAHSFAMKHGGGHAGRTNRREAAVLAAIHAMRRTLTEFQRHLAAASGDSISTLDAMALQFMAHAGDTTPRHITAFTGLTSGSVSIMLDRLETAGFVTRKRASKDRRVVTVQLVPGARQRLMGIMLEAHKSVGMMFDGWKVQEIEQLVALLERMRASPA
jgi:DNA-binding MarR family transcriptional regulator